MASTTNTYVTDMTHPLFGARPGPQAQQPPAHVATSCTAPARLSPLERLPQEVLTHIADYLVPHGASYATLAGVSGRLRGSMLDAAMHRLTVATAPKRHAVDVLPQAAWLELEQARHWLTSVAIGQGAKLRQMRPATPTEQTNQTACPNRAPQGHSPAAQRFASCVVGTKLDALGPLALWGMLKPWVQEHAQLGLELYAAQAAVHIVSAYRSGAARLDLSGLGLRSLPDCLGHLTALRQLQLSDNHLRMLPAALGALVQLEHLWLGDNQLEYLPEAFKQLTALRTLSLCCNDFSVLPSAVLHMTALQRLELNANFFAGFPVAVTGVGTLQALRLDAYLCSVLPEATKRELEGRGVILEP